jgi:hypothetical protein
MTIPNDIVWVLRRKPGLTEVQLSDEVFGSAGYQQRVNLACRSLVKRGVVERRGHGGVKDPYRYFLASSRIEKNLTIASDD